MQSRPFPAKFDQVSISIWRTLPFLDETFPLPLDAPFTSSQALAEGVRPNLLTELCRLGLLRRPVKGVYVVSQLGDSVELRARALRLVVPEDCVICDRHAGWLHGAEMVLAPNEHVELRPVSVFRPAGMGRLRNGLTDSGERNLRPTTSWRCTASASQHRCAPLGTSAGSAVVTARCRGLTPCCDSATSNTPSFSTAYLGSAGCAGSRSYASSHHLRTDGRVTWRVGTTAPLDRPLATDSTSAGPGGRVRRTCTASRCRERGGAPRRRVPRVGVAQRPRTARARQRAPRALEQQEWVVVPVWRSDLWGPTADVERLLLGGLVEARRRFGARILHQRRH